VIDLERVFLVKARESLAGAIAEQSNGRFNNAANRAYYACFQAAIHALQREGIRPPGGGDRWGHDFVQAQFAGQLVNRRKLYAVQLRDTLMRVFVIRRAADYSRDLIGDRQAMRALQRASELVEAVAARDGGTR
jgi:uncharacterized protein (UPF0332 family)